MVGICSMTHGIQTGALWQSGGVGWEGRWEGVLEGKGMGVPVDDSCWCMTENHRIL